MLNYRRTLKHDPITRRMMVRVVDNVDMEGFCVASDGVLSAEQPFHKHIDKVFYSQGRSWDDAFKKFSKLTVSDISTDDRSGYLCWFG